MRRKALKLIVDTFGKIPKPTRVLDRPTRGSRPRMASAP